EPYRQATTLWKELSDEEPGSEWYRRERAYFSLGLARLLQAAGRSEAAVECCRTSVRLNEQLSLDFPDRYVERLRYARNALIAVLCSLGRDEEAEEFLRNGSPSADELNNHAWTIVGRPDPSAGATRLAIRMAQRAVELNPDKGHHWNTLGVAHYRA